MKEYILIMPHTESVQLKLTKTFAEKYDNITSFDDILSIISNEYELRSLESENAFVIAYDYSGRAIGIYHVSIGDYKKCQMYNRTIATFLLLVGAKKFCCLHNHPGTSLEPSLEDIANEGTLCALSKLLEIEFIGSYIVNHFGYRCVTDPSEQAWDPEFDDY